MSLLSSNRLIASLLATAAFALVLPHRAEAAQPLRACVDTANPNASFDRELVKAVAKAEGRQADIVTFNSRERDDDDGFSPHRFVDMANKTCALVMGFPVEKGGDWSFMGLHHTAGYRDTGFVLAGLTQPPAWKSLPAGTSVGVTYNTPANLFFVNRPGLKPDIFNTDEDSVKALQAHKVKAAILWEPSLQNASKKAGGTKIAYHPLDLPHAKWMIAALYADRSKQEAATFNRIVKQMAQKGELAKLGKPQTKSGPQLFSQAQAIEGKHLFASHCAACHGANMEGVVGPALKGPGFASPDDNFTVGGMFSFLSTQMPAGSPGSLTHKQYAALMAFILQQNGYSAGSQALTYQQATVSKTPLISHGDPTSLAQATTD